MKLVLLGVTSGIAAYKSLTLIKLLGDAGIITRVIMTKNSMKMVDPVRFEKASGHKIYSELFEKDFSANNILKNRHVEHIDVADNTDLFVIIPATANVIAKLAHGIADDYLTTTALAITKPLLVCPSMNVNMWNNPVTQENIETLRSRGHHIIEPTEGELACGYVGKGRLEEVTVIRDEILTRLNQTSLLKGKRILITTGGTAEPIDNVRFITNRSSGKMGIALAESCYLRGAEVTLLCSKSSVKPRFLIKEETFETTNDLYALVKKHTPKVDIIFHVAAVSDFTVANQHHGKLSSKQRLNLRLTQTIKISNEIKKINPNALLVLFKAEYNLPEKELLKAAKQKLEESNAEAVIVNDVSKLDRGFEADTNEVYILLKNGKNKKIPLGLKKDVAEKIVSFLYEHTKITTSLFAQLN